MGILNDISEALQSGRAKVVKELTQKALDEGISASEILQDALLSGMDIIGEKFKKNEVYVPEVLVAARSMNAGMEILKPHLAEGSSQSIGKAVIGTVKGDLHDIGKNLVRMMIEGKGIEVVDLGIDVPAEKFLETFKNENCDIVCCSALLTTTMGQIKKTIELFEKEGLREKAIFMVGGAPVTDSFRQAVGADYYSPDAASAAETAKQALLARAQ